MDEQNGVLSDTPHGVQKTWRDWVIWERIAFPLRVFKYMIPFFVERRNTVFVCIAFSVACLVMLNYAKNLEQDAFNAGVSLVYTDMVVTSSSMKTALKKEFAKGQIIQNNELYNQAKTQGGVVLREVVAKDGVFVDRDGNVNLSEPIMLRVMVQEKK